MMAAAGAICLVCRLVTDKQVGYQQAHKPWQAAKQHVILLKATRDV